MTLEDITAEVKEKELITTTMGELRNAAGNKRLGKHVRSAIKAALEEVGVNTFPSTLPASQDAIVRLYNESSNLGRIFHALSDPSPESDDILREFIVSKGKAKNN